MFDPKNLTVDLHLLAPGVQADPLDPSQADPLASQTSQTPPFDIWIVLWSQEGNELGRATYRGVTSPELDVDVPISTRGWLCSWQVFDCTTGQYQELEHRRTESAFAVRPGEMWSMTLRFSR